MNKILCTPAEAIQLRTDRTQQEIEWAQEIARFYQARPLKSDALNFYTFVADVFAAGRISGVREERIRRKGVKANGND